MSFSLDPALEQQLLSDFRDGTQAARECAFEALCRQLRQPLLALCLSLTRNRASAEDALQETLLAAWQGLNGFEGRSANQASAYQLRVFPRTLDGVRADGIRNWDINLKRDFRVTESMKVRIQVDDLNATNHTNFSGPSTDPTSGNFGKITSQRGLSRIIQFNLRIEF